MHFPNLQHTVQGPKIDLDFFYSSWVHWMWWKSCHGARCLLWLLSKQPSHRNYHGWDYWDIQRISYTPENKNKVYMLTVCLCYSVFIWLADSPFVYLYLFPYLSNALLLRSVYLWLLCCLFCFSNSAFMPLRCTSRIFSTVKILFCFTSDSLSWGL